MGAMASTCRVDRLANKGQSHSLLPFVWCDLWCSAFAPHRETIPQNLRFFYSFQERTPFDQHRECWVYHTWTWLVFHRIWSLYSWYWSSPLKVGCRIWDCEVIFNYYYWPLEPSKRRLNVPWNLNFSNAFTSNLGRLSLKLADCNNFTAKFVIIILWVLDHTFLAFLWSSIGRTLIVYHTQDSCPFFAMQYL